MPTQPKRHHYVPVSYLRRFADAKGRIRVYPAHTEMPSFETSIKNAAVQAGFYTIQTPDAKSSALEVELGKVEARAREAVETMLGGSFPPPPPVRADMALFLALQYLRTPEQRMKHEVMVDTMEKVFCENISESRASERLVEMGREPSPEMVQLVMDVSRNPDAYMFRPHPNEFLRIMVEVAVNGVAPVLSAKSWFLGTSTGPALVTGDHPLVLLKHPAGASPYRGGGLEDAEELFFPLDRHRVLVLCRDRAYEQRIFLSRDHVSQINSAIVNMSYQYVYQHPQDPLISSMIPISRRPLMSVNLEPFFEREKDSLKVLEPMFIQHFVRMPSESELAGLAGRMIPREEMIHFGT